MLVYVGIFHGHFGLVYGHLVMLWSFGTFFPHFGKLCHEKSGNLALTLSQSPSPRFERRLFIFYTDLILLSRPEADILHTKLVPLLYSKDVVNYNQKWLKNLEYWWLHRNDMNVYTTIFMFSIKNIQMFCFVKFKSHKFLKRLLHSKRHIPCRSNMQIFIQLPPFILAGFDLTIFIVAGGDDSNRPRRQFLFRSICCRLLYLSSG
jgi:hypothetical protein